MQLRIFVLSCFVLACASAGAADVHSMTGCLARGDADGHFILTDVEGVGTVVIEESTIDLERHVGHKIEITGTSVADASDDAHTMQVSDLKHLAETCP